MSDEQLEKMKADAVSAAKELCEYLRSQPDDKVGPDRKYLDELSDRVHLLAGLVEEAEVAAVRSMLSIGILSYLPEKMTEQEISELKSVNSVGIAVVLQILRRMRTALSTVSPDRWAWRENQDAARLSLYDRILGPLSIRKRLNDYMVAVSSPSD